VSSKILDGRALAAELRAELAARVAALSDRGVVPRLVVALAGEDPSSLAYVRGLEKLGAQIGVEVAIDRLPAAIGEPDFRAALEGYGRDDAIHGVLVQQPLPPPLSMRSIADAVPADKDVDCTHPLNQARLAFGSGPRFVPATPRAVMLLLERSEKWPLRGRDATVIGRSSVVGLPVAMLLLARDATVTIAHSKTADLRAQAQRAEILVVAAGIPGLVDASYIRPGATVIDVGTTVVDGKLRGDVDFESVSALAGELTPVPGGVGPVTNVALMGNVVSAAENLS
jgi:methylenetetrahydrofolate dehydrogenase (NADP+)/methenyltetrahydrofolate cyclohydrolase